MAVSRSRKAPRTKAIRAALDAKRSSALAIRDNLRAIVEARRGSYRAATNPRSRVQTPMGGSADQHVDDLTRRLTRELARDLDRNAGAFQTIGDKVVEFTVGAGVQVRPMSKDPEWNRKAAELIHARMSKVDGGLDARQMRSGYTLQGLFARALFVDGDAGFVKLANGLAQLIESDQIIPNPKQPRGKGGRFASSGSPSYLQHGGIPLDEAGRPIAFYVAPFNAAGTLDVAAGDEFKPDEFLFAAITSRATQTRGMPRLSGVLDDFERSDSYIESEVIAAENGSQVFMTVEYPLGKNPSTGFTPTDTDQNDQQVRGGLKADGTPDWQPTAAGSVMVCPDGMVAKPYSPERPNVNAEPFVTFLLRLYCAAAGWPYELIFGDLRNMSWSTAKTLIDLANNVSEAFQLRYLAPVFSSLYLWQVRLLIDDNQLEDIEGWDRHEHQWPRLSQPDEQKFFQSNLVGFQSGQTSRSRVFGARALEIMDELAAERRHAAGLARALNKEFPEFPTAPEHFLGLPQGNLLALPPATDAELPAAKPDPAPSKK